MTDPQIRAVQEAIMDFVNSVEGLRVSQDGVVSGSWVKAKFDTLKELGISLGTVAGTGTGTVVPVGLQPEAPWERPVKKTPSFGIDKKINNFLADKPAHWNGRFFFLMIERMVETFIRKNTDYAGQDHQGADMLVSFRESEDIQVSMLKGILVRAGDKWRRIKNLTRENRAGMVRDETIVDTMLDLAIYMVIAIVAHMSTHPTNEHEVQSERVD